jgi:hypothetical protein
MPEYELAPSTQMDARADIAREFFSAVLDDDEHPYFVSDQATLYDIFSGDERDLCRRCLLRLGFELREAHFRMPLWELLDLIACSRGRAT